MVPASTAIPHVLTLARFVADRSAARFFAIVLLLIGGCHHDPGLNHAAVADGEQLLLARLRQAGMSDRVVVRAEEDGCFSVYLAGSSVTDLASLEGVPIGSLSLDATAVSDLSPLAGMPLCRLAISGTNSIDLNPLSALPLRSLKLAGVHVEDLSPLEGLPLEELHFWPKHVRTGLDVLLRIKTLKEISTGSDEEPLHMYSSPQAFWRWHEEQTSGR